MMTPNFSTVGTSISELVTWTIRISITILWLQQMAKAKNSVNVTESAIRKN